MNLFMNTNGEVAVTEGALKAYCAWCFSGKPFIGIPGVGQTACLESFFQEKKEAGPGVGVHGHGQMDAGGM